MNPEISDQHLIEAVAGGDLDAFNELVLRYQGVAWKTAYRFLGDAMEAEDAAQLVFLKILEAASRYRAEAAFSTYFFRILTHICIDRTRKKQLSHTDDYPEAADPALDPRASLIARERSQQVRAALDSLPPNQKAAIILKHYEGLSYADIAQILGVTPKAVERLISRARASLSSILAHI